MKVLSNSSLLALLLTVVGQVLPAEAQIPRFLAPVSYSVPGATIAALADLNGDGIIDIVTANGGSPTGDGGVSVLLGFGNGKFHPARKIVSGGSPGDVVIADFNNDGKLDIAVANEPNPNTGIVAKGGPPTDSVSLLLGNGDGTFQPAIDTTTPGALRMSAADFNGDGKLDLAINTDTTVHILLNKGDGTFAVSDTGVSAFSIVVTGDFNRDGKADVLAGGFVLLGNGDGTFATGQGLDQLPILAADFNGDGILDLASTAVSGGRRIIGELALGQTGGTFAPSLIQNFSGFGIAAADFNGDGKMDVFGTGDKTGDGIDPPIGGLSLGQGDGTFLLAAPGFGAPFGQSIVAAFPDTADLDRNGSPDLVIANGTSVLVALNTFGHPPLLAQLTTDSTFVLGGTTTVTGTVALGGPAPAAGAVITLTSSNPAAFFPNGMTVTVPAKAVTATFAISINAVTTTTPVTISATFHATRLTSTLNVVPPFTEASLTITPTSLIGMLGGDTAVGTVTLTGPASNGTVVKLSSASPAMLSVPASVTFAPGAKTATFSAVAQHVAADTSIAISATLGTTTQSATVTVRKETSTVTITKAEYVVKKGLLSIEATSSDRVASLQIFNPTTGALVGSIPLVNVGKFTGQLVVSGTFTSAAAQSSVGGLSIAAVAQK